MVQKRVVHQHDSFTFDWILYILTLLLLGALHAVLHRIGVRF
jgi:hypothetical protein